MRYANVQGDLQRINCRLRKYIRQTKDSSKYPLVYHICTPHRHNIIGDDALLKDRIWHERNGILGVQTCVFPNIHLPSFF
jgi:hypothetical protein